MVLKDEATAKVRPISARVTAEVTPSPKPAPANPLQRSRAWIKQRRMLILGVAVAILAGAGLALVPRLFKSPAAGYSTATVTRGSIEDTVTALGNLQPLAYVDVGAQVSGQIQAIHVDIGDKVQKGDLLVEIDPKVQQARVDESKSQLVSAQAQLLQRQADLKLKQAAAAREERLHAEGADSQAEYEVAMAALATSQAAVKAQQAQIEQAQSTLDANVTTLGYSKILAPIDGTVVSLTAKVGQTINATQQAPTILRIADLSTMTAWTQVSEADVPRLKIGMPAYLTTLGDSTRRHEGELRQILPTPEVQNNVVLYNALFDVPNTDNLLMTQMTAQVFFQVASASNVLTAPVAALQMGNITGAGRQAQGNGAGANGNAPAGQGGASDSAAQSGAGNATSPAGSGGARGGRNGTRNGNVTDEQRAAWRAARANGNGGAGSARRQFVTVVKPGGALERRAVVVGISNRVTAEIKSGLEEGEIVVVGKKQASATTSGSQRSPLVSGPGRLGMMGGRP